MIRRYAFGMLAVAAMLVVAAPAQAGGGVKNTSIKTSNSSGVTVVAFSVDPNKIPSFPETVADAQKLGGVVIPNGSTKTVKVLSGNNMVYVAIMVGDGGILNYSIGSAEALYSLKKGASTTALIAGEGGIPPTGITMTIPKP